MKLAYLATLFVLVTSFVAMPETGFAADEGAGDDLFADEDDGLDDLFSDDAVEPEISAEAPEDDLAPAPDALVSEESDVDVSPGATGDSADFGDDLLGGANSSATPSADTEEILVMGEATEGILEEETTSAVSFDEDTLRMEGIQDISDLSNFTPNLEIKTAFAATNPTLFIRGIGLDDYNANSASAVAVYQDGVYMNSPVGQLFQLFDVGNINVLRGPQARLRNANAGSIQIHSQMPTHDLEGFAQGTYGRFNRWTVTGAINVPLVSEVLSSRLSFIVNQGDGITENRCHDRAGVPTLPSGALNPCVQVAPGIDENVNDTDNWAARALFLLTPQAADWDPPEILVNFHGGKNDSLAAQFQHRGFQGTFGNDILQPGPDRFNYQDTDGDPFAGEYNASGKEKIDLLGGSVRMTWPASDSVEIVSLSAVEWHQRNTLANDDASPRVWFDRFHYRDDAWQFSEELTLHWLLGESGEIDFGGLYLMEDLDADNVFPNERAGTRMPRIEQKYTQKTRGFSLYAYGRTEIPPIEALPDFITNFAVDGTVRYAYEFKDFDLDSQATTFFAGVPTVLPQISEIVSEDWQGVSGDISLTYYLGRHFDNEDVSVYGKYSRGWKPGHFNGGTALAIELVEPVDPEEVDSFEIGLRSQWFDQRLRLDLTAFHYMFTDQQIFQLQQEGVGVPLPRLINAQESEIWGAEVELELEPIDRLELVVNAGWLDSEYTEFKTSIIFQGGGGVLNPPTVFAADYTGNRLLASPEWSASGSVQYTLELSHFGSLRPRYSFTYKDDVFFDPNEGAGARGNLPAGTIGQKAYWVHNAMLTYMTPDERIEITGWVRNITDEEYRVQSFDLTERNFQFVLDAYGDPLTYGVTAVLRF